MNRKQFLNRLGLGLGVAIALPFIPAKEEKQKQGYAVNMDTGEMHPLPPMEEVEYKPRSISTNIKLSKEYYDSLWNSYKREGLVIYGDVWRSIYEV